MPLRCSRGRDSKMEFIFSSVRLGRLLLELFSILKGTVRKPLPKSYSNAPVLLNEEEAALQANRAARASFERLRRKREPIHALSPIIYIMS